MGGWPSRLYAWPSWLYGGGPCDFSVSPSPFGLDLRTLDSDFGLGLKIYRSFRSLSFKNEKYDGENFTLGGSLDARLDLEKIEITAFINITKKEHDILSKYTSKIQVK